MTTPPYDTPDLTKHAPTLDIGPSWKDPEPDVEDAPPFEDAAERSAPAQPTAAGERYWTDSRILRLGATLVFAALSLVVIVTLAAAFPAAAWLPYLVGMLVYGALAGKAWSAHWQAEEGARARAHHEANAPYRRLHMQSGS